MNGHVDDLVGDGALEVAKCRSAVSAGSVRDSNAGVGDLAYRDTPGESVDDLGAVCVVRAVVINSTGDHQAIEAGAV